MQDYIIKYSVRPETCKTVTINEGLQKVCSGHVTTVTELKHAKVMVMSCI